MRTWLVEWADRKGYDIHVDGLVVRTTLHGPLQLAANEAVRRQMARLDPFAKAASGGVQPLQAGFVALDPRNGRVCAWVGSRDFAGDQFDHVEQARRQPGSTFKPFVYGAAFTRGMRPTDTLIDESVEIAVGRGEVWRPADVTPPTGQPMTLSDGLAHSRNSITAQLIAKLGPGRVAKLAEAMGVRESKLDKVPALALGASPVTLKEMVAAYGAIANGGTYRAPVIIMRVEDRHGRVLETFAAEEADNALDREQALMLVDALRAAVDRGTARAIRDVYGIRADVAGKTGTTQENTDGWLILMHPQLVGGAWVGFNDGRFRMGDRWGPGASSALPIVAEVFQHALQRAWIDPGAGFGRGGIPKGETAAVAGAGGWLARMMGDRRDAHAAAQPREVGKGSDAPRADAPGERAAHAGDTPRVFPPWQAPRPPAAQEGDARRPGEGAEERLALRPRNDARRGWEGDDEDNDDREEVEEDEVDEEDRGERKWASKAKKQKKHKHGKHRGDSEAAAGRLPPARGNIAQGTRPACSTRQMRNSSRIPGRRATSVTASSLIAEAGPHSIARLLTQPGHQPMRASPPSVGLAPRARRAAHRSPFAQQAHETVARPHCGALKQPVARAAV